MLGSRVPLEPPDHLPMLPFPRLLSGAPVRLPQAPCASCLLDLAESSGMAGAAPCPLKAALLRRLAEGPITAGEAATASCGAFLPGFADEEVEAPPTVVPLAGRLLS